jgi:hypothetical protein
VTHAYGYFGSVRLLCAAFLCGLTLSAALAQDSNVFNGKWTAIVAGDPRTAQVVIADSAGYWTRGRPSFKQACPGKHFPLTVTSHSATDIVFEVDGSKLIPGCAHFSVTAKAIDANTLEGTSSSGGSIKLVRR